MNRSLFKNRSEAGKLLAQKLKPYANRDDVLVLAIPRGGVPVAYEVTRKLHVPLEIFIVRKLGVPGHEELAMGAIASGGIRVFNKSVVSQLQIPMNEIDRVTSTEIEELQRREQVYRGNEEPIELNEKTVILIDDGIATGSTMRVAIEALRQQGVTKTIVAVPVASYSCLDQLDADEIVALFTPKNFLGIGQFYEDFSQITDEEVCELLQGAHERI